MDRIKQADEEFARTKKDAQDLINKAIDENRDLTDPENEENQKRFAHMERIKRQRDESLRFSTMAITAALADEAAAIAAGAPARTTIQTEHGTVTLPSDAPGRQEFERSQREAAEHFGLAPRPGESPEGARERFHRDAINNFLRTGDMPDKRFTLITTTGSGVLVPPRAATVPIVVKRMRNVIRAALAARGVPLITTDGMEDIPVPVLDDSANTADTIAQSATGDNPKDPAVTNLTLGAPLRDSGTVWFSNTLLQSAGFDLLAYIEPMLDIRIERTELAAWFASLVAATVGVTTASTTGVTYDELLTWQHSIAVPLRGDGVFFVADGLFRAVRGLKDTTGNPIYQESLRDDAPNTLLGWPIFITDGLATPGANVVSGVAASASTLVIRDVRNKRIARYSNQPAWRDQFGIAMFANNGFAFLPSGVRTLKQAAA